jgi:hypothetical protein
MNECPLDCCQLSSTRLKDSVTRLRTEALAPFYYVLIASTRMSTATEVLAVDVGRMGSGGPRSLKVACNVCTARSATLKQDYT